MRTTLAVLCLSQLGIVPAALADAIDDVRSGTNLTFTSAQARYDGETFSAGAWDIPKAAGTLGMTVPLSRFGLDHPGSIALTGARSGSQIIWRFDSTLSPVLESGSVRIERVRGTLVARARLLPGGATPSCGGASCAHNVLLTPGPGSSIRVSGCNYIFPACWGFDEAITVRTFRGFGGLPRPLLQSVSVSSPASQCGATRTTYTPGLVTLRSIAPSGGAFVELRSTDPSGVRVRPVRVRAGSRSARFTVAMAPGWTGSVQVIASAGGVEQMRLVERRRCLILELPWLLTLLPALGDYVGLLSDKHVLLRTKSAYAVWDAEQKKAHALEQLASLELPTVVSYTPNGELSGKATLKGQPVAFRWNIHQADDEPDIYANAQPLAVSPLGLVLAETAPGAAKWQLLHNWGARPVAPLDGLELASNAGGSAGDFAATVIDEAESYPALVSLDGVKRLLETEGEAVDVITSGVVVGHAKNENGLRQPFRWTPEEGAIWQPVPPGCKSATVVDLNENGWFLAHAECGEGPMPYVTDDAGTPMRLDALDQYPDVTWRAVALGDDNTILLSAETADAGIVYYLLHH